MTGFNRKIELYRLSKNFEIDERTFHWIAHIIIFRISYASKLVAAGPVLLIVDLSKHKSAQ